MSVLVETTLGDIVIDLFCDDRPRSCLNFLKLCKLKYYNFCTFHSIEANFMAQTGDPTGTGKSGESVYRLLYGDQASYFECEELPKLSHSARGTLSMVDNGAGAHGSQFFITLAPNLDYLDETHTVFGRVVEGLELLDKLNEVLCDEQNKPYQAIHISHVIILADPFEDPSGLKFPERSPSPTLAILKDGIPLDESLDDDQGKTQEQIQEETEAKEAMARAHILEMVGDLHHAEEAPPDNVLFVCKLNPVTTDDDLMIIFSRFGAIKSCEVIRDHKTGNSLQYAFVEFERPEDCETAYFKMDNVLIDDRRIHVDFSQSVAKNQPNLFKGTSQANLPSKLQNLPSQSSRRSKDRASKSRHGDVRKRSPNGQYRRSPDDTRRLPAQSRRRSPAEVNLRSADAGGRRHSAYRQEKRRGSPELKSRSRLSPEAKIRRSQDDSRRTYDRSTESKKDTRKRSPDYEERRRERKLSPVQKRSANGREDRELKERSDRHRDSDRKKSHKRQHD